MGVDPIDVLTSAYNEIDARMRKETGMDRDATFGAVLKRYAAKRGRWRHTDTLQRLAQLRNVLTHEVRKPGEHLATPTPWVLDVIERIREDVMDPQKVAPLFLRQVTTVALHDTVGELLRQIHRLNYSQFPVIAEDGFRGLVTENGLTRWLASHVTHQLSLLDLEEHCVRDVLECEEARENYQFVGRRMLVDELTDRFRERPDIEAALITERGDPRSSILGIATRWDMLQLRGAA